jgi:tRNA threonylcarbamoyladenosine biosynthesis protein TsaE
VGVTMPDRSNEPIIQSHSTEQTIQIGRVIGSEVEPNTIITLSGNLGAGKTWLAKGIAFGLDVSDYEYVTSPAFELIHEYKGRLTIYHLDLYRLDSLSIDDLMMIQDLFNTGGLCLIEWPNRLEQYPSLYPDNSLAVQIESPDSDNPNERTLQFSARGDKHRALLERMSRKLNL